MFIEKEELQKTKLKSKDQSHPKDSQTNYEDPFDDMADYHDSSSGSFNPDEFASNTR